VSKIGTPIGDKAHVVLPGDRYDFPGGRLWAAIQNHTRASIREALYSPGVLEGAEARVTRTYDWLWNASGPVSKVAEAYQAVVNARNLEGWIVDLAKARQEVLVTSEYGRILFDDGGRLMIEKLPFTRDIESAFNHLPDSRKGAMGMYLQNMEGEMAAQVRELQRPLRFPTENSLPEKVLVGQGAAAERAPASILPARTSATEMWKLEEKGLTAEARASRETVTNTLREGKIVASEDVMGLSKPKLVTFEDGTKGIWKPYEAHIHDDPELASIGNGASEIAAYKVDRQLGLNHVPITVERSFEGRLGTVQHFVESGNTRGAGLKGTEAALFDGLINESDRSTSNLLRAADGRVVAIDHGNAFATNSRAGFEKYLRSLRGYIEEYQFAGEVAQKMSRETTVLMTGLSEREVLMRGEFYAGRTTNVDVLAIKRSQVSQMLAGRDVVRRLEATSPAEWEKLLKPELSGQQIQEFLARREAILQAVADAKKQLGVDIVPVRPNETRVLATSSDSFQPVRSEGVSWSSITHQIGTYYRQLVSKLRRGYKGLFGGGSSGAEEDLEPAPAT